jgi:[protein-PII] uridylyltransferase
VALLRQDLIRALDGSLDLAQALEAKERDYGETSAAEGMTREGSYGDADTKLLWFDDEATKAVVLELRTTDRIGLLYRVATAMESQGVTIRWARVVTLGSSVVDSFCLTGADGYSALTAALRARVESAVLRSAGEHRSTIPPHARNP